MFFLFSQTALFILRYEDISLFAKILDSVQINFFEMLMANLVHPKYSHRVYADLVSLFFVLIRAAQFTV